MFSMPVGAQTSPGKPAAHSAAAPRPLHIELDAIPALSFPPTTSDITQGNNTFGPFTNGDGKTYTVEGYTAGPGYDLASGLGTFNGAALVRALAERARGE